MNSNAKQVVIIGGAVVSLIVGVIASNERNHSYEKAVEKMHRETDKPSASMASTTNELPRIKQRMSWTDQKPTNAPISLSPKEASK